MDETIQATSQVSGFSRHTTLSGMYWLDKESPVYAQLVRQWREEGRDVPPPPERQF